LSIWLADVLEKHVDSVKLYVRRTLYT